MILVDATRNFVVSNRAPTELVGVASLGEKHVTVPQEIATCFIG